MKKKYNSSVLDQEEALQFTRSLMGGKKSRLSFRTGHRINMTLKRVHTRWIKVGLVGPVGLGGLVSFLPKGPAGIF